ncbi:MAG: glycosyltransferase family 2 protein [Phycisphaera sp.]|nr:glycosyltransferase family 2 protein [Phycisphaera sp.]
MPSVIIPAHNEEAGIAKTLRGVLADDIPDLEVVVVVNASTDRTAEIAGSLDSRVKVIDTPVPGKTNALNLGEAELTSFPRVFLDADIELKPGTLASIIAASGDPHAIVSPRPTFDLTGCGLGMRLFMQANRYNNYFGRGAPNGSGCFVLTREGRGRWGEFPDVVADDGFVHGHFRSSEAATVEGTTAIVGPPHDLGSMTKVRARVRRGRMELDQRFPELMKNHESQVGGSLGRMLVRPWTWPALAVYCWVRISERRLARRQLAAGETGWGRDESARTG